MRIFLLLLLLLTATMSALSAHSALQKTTKSVSSEASLPKYYLTSQALQIALKSSLTSEQTTQLAGLSKSLRTEITLLKKSTKLSAIERYQSYRKLLELNANNGARIVL